MNMIFNDTDFFPLNSAAQSRISDLEIALEQAVMELNEAANICRQNDMAKTAEIFRMAAARKAELLEGDHVR